MKTDLWQSESRRYSKRLKKLVMQDPKVIGLITKLPKIPLEYHPSSLGLVAVNLSIFASSCKYFTHNVVLTFLNLWDQGLLTTISLPVRLAFELWGATHFALKTARDFENTGNLDKAISVTQKLTLGARSDVDLPWGGKAEVKSINVKDFIRSLEDVEPQTESIYDFLCESCHPSFLMLTTWLIHNWSNAVFRKRTHELLRRTLKAMEQAIVGIDSDVVNILEWALPHIEQDQIQAGSSSSVKITPR